MSGPQKAIKILAIILAIFIIFNIIKGIIIGLTFFARINNNNDNNTEVKTFSQSYQNVSKIDIETVSADIIIKNGSEIRVEANNIKNNFTSNIKNGTLKIEENKTWFNSSSIVGKITVYIPEKINNLKIDSGAGKIQVSDIKANNFKIDQGAGKLTIENSSFTSSDINGGAGEIKIVSSELNNLKLDAGVGKIDLEGKITGNSKIECGIGEMNISLLGDKDQYNIVAEKGIGSIKINGKERTEYGEGENKIKLEGGIGAINVNFSEQKTITNNNMNENFLSDRYL